MPVTLPPPIAIWPPTSLAQTAGVTTNDRCRARHSRRERVHGSAEGLLQQLLVRCQAIVSNCPRLPLTRSGCHESLRDKSSCRPISIEVRCGGRDRRQQADERLTRRKPPSQFEFFSLRNGVMPASGQVANERGQPGMEFWRFVNHTGEAGVGVYESIEEPQKNLRR
jgi:hypothetical protein